MKLIWAVILLSFIIYIAYRLGLLLKNKNSGAPGTFLLAFMSITVAVSMVLYPQKAFEASVSGLDIWWNIVFPALLPFFIMAQVLIGLGAVNMMGVFLEPVMRPLFNVPGVGSFVLAMGLASGFPLGAIITADMRRKKMLSKIEAERLVSFVNTADPLFMFGAVAVGMIGLPGAGLTIAAAHYLSTLSIGFLMRFYRRDKTPAPSRHPMKDSLLNRAVNALIEARKKDGRPFGQLMGDAIHKSLQTLLLIGGFIILFSVIIRILGVIGIVDIFTGAISVLMTPLSLDVSLAPAIFSGLLEIDLGCQYAASASAPLQDILIVTGFIIAWSGLSVHAQVASIVSDTDISIIPYIWARCIHAILAGFYTYALLQILPYSQQNISLPVLYQMIPASEFSFWWARTTFITYQMIVFLGVMAILSILVYFTKNILPVIAGRTTK